MEESCGKSLVRALELQAMEDLTPQSFFDLREYRHHRFFQECTYVWEALLNIKSYLNSCTLGNIEIAIPDGITLVHPEQISIGKGTRIEAGAFLQGPCLIGEGCLIRQGAYIRGNVIMGDGCVIGHASEIKHSILLDRARAAHFNYVGDSILGNDTNLGAGFVCSNFRFDGEVIKVYFNGEKILTGIKKLGVILGDSSSLGCNGVSNPGTLIGKGAVSYPCVNFGGVFEPSSVISSQNLSIL